MALTESEMNALGARLVKAELMGNEEMVAQIKSKMASARRAAEEGIKPKSESGEKVRNRLSLLASLHTGR